MTNTDGKIRTSMVAGCYGIAAACIHFRGVGAGGARGASAPPLFSLGVHCTPTFPGEKLSI